jgi:hypothetical protein
VLAFLLRGVGHYKHLRHRSWAVTSCAIPILEGMGRIANGYRTPGLSANCSASRHRNAALHRGAWAVLCLACAVATIVKGAPNGALLWIALAAYLASKARERLHLESSFRLGAEAEERVGILLDEAMGWGWAVEHDVLKQGGGNIDHVVHSPSMTFTIDTKRSSWCGRDLDQAHRHAEWAIRYYGAQRPIAPVICVQRSGDPAMEVDGVVVVGGTRLLGFLGSMHWPESIAGDEDLFEQSQREADFEELFGVGA